MQSGNRIQCGLFQRLRPSAADGPRLIKRSEIDAPVPTAAARLHPDDSRFAVKLDSFSRVKDLALRLRDSHPRDFGEPRISPVRN
jgi:hypothetical protein